MYKQFREGEVMYKQLGKWGMLCAYRPGMGSQGRGGCYVHIMGDGGAICICIWVEHAIVWIAFMRK